MDIYPFTKKQALWIDEEYCYYLIASNGIFIVKRNELFSVVVPALEIGASDKKRIKRSRLDEYDLKEITPQVFLHFPVQIAFSIFSNMVALFREVWNNYGTETHVQLFYDEEDEAFFYLIPEIWASRQGDFCYFNFLPSPPGAMWVGTVHSHGTMPAFQSGIDYHTEHAVDGLHITIGNVTSLFPTVNCRIVVNGFNFPVEADQVIAGPEMEEDEVPDINIIEPRRSYPRGSSGHLAIEAYNEPITTVRKIWENYVEVKSTTYVIIGLGGVGSHFTPSFCRWLDNHQPQARVVLVDGGRFESRKKSRQSFPETGNKADVLANHLMAEFTSLEISSVGRHIDEDNAESLIPDNSIVFLMPDNHQARKVVSDHAQTLQNVVVITGGNDAADDESGGLQGNVMVYIRIEGLDKTAPITSYHPEIDEASGEIDDDQSCEANQPLIPQLLMTNLAVASHMLNTFATLNAGDLTYGELFFTLGADPGVATYERPPQQD